MFINRKLHRLLAIAVISSISAVPAVVADEGGKAAPKATAAQADLPFRELPLLDEAFIDTSPPAKSDGLAVQELSIAAEATNALVQLAQEIGDGIHGRYDSLLISYKGSLMFESYFKRGRINLAHPQASATKGYTSLILGRAIQLGYLTMDDLNRPLIDFLPDLDRSKLVDGAEKITLHKALTMHGGLNVSDATWKELEKVPSNLQGQGLVQKLLENSEPITDETQIYRYGNYNTMLVMTVIDAVVPGSAKDFIKTEFLDKLGITNYSWDTHISGLPQAGWMVSMTSRDMLKLGSVVLNHGKWNGEQLVPTEYLTKATSGLVKPTQDWMPDAYRYGYFWYQLPVKISGESHDITLAWGGGGQRVIVVPSLDLVIAITGHGRDDRIMNQIAETILPAFAE